MKKATFTAFYLFFIFFCSFAQAAHDEWRLIKIAQVYSNEKPNTSEYVYNKKGELTAIYQYYNNNFSKDADNSSTKDFVYNNAGYITSFTQYDPERITLYELGYDSKNRLISKQLSILNTNGKLKEKKLANIIKYSYAGNEIKESYSTPASQKVIDVTAYIFDVKGNIIRQERKEMATMKTEKYICGDFDNKPNPNLFTGGYFYTGIQSKQNEKNGHWEGMTPAQKSVFVYDAQGMLEKTTVTETDDNKLKTSVYTYTYAKIKIP